LNPLQRDGTNQNQRLLDALNPEKILIDDRDAGDLLKYAIDFAGLIRYYNNQNFPDGNWVTFIKNDISTIVAMIKTLPLKLTRKELRVFI
jgi:hypothetical protein